MHCSPSLQPAFASKTSRTPNQEDAFVRRSYVFLFVALIALSTLSSAQLSSGNAFFGYSYASTDLSRGGNTNLNGWEGSLEGKLAPFIGIVADIDGHYGSTSRFPTSSGSLVHVSASEYNFLFGPRLSFSVRRARPFAHALFGASHVSVSGNGYSASDTSFGYALGGGLDYKLWGPVGWRFQGDFLQTRFFGTTQNDGRFSTGIVFRF
jgi:opacity protein-like surface antigen